MPRWLLACLLAVLAFSPPLAHAQEPGWVQTDRSPRVGRDEIALGFVVTTRALNLRPAPSVERPPVAVAHEGDVVRRLGETFNTTESRAWVEVQLRDGARGWVAASFLRPVSRSLAEVEKALDLAAALAPAGGRVASRPALDEVRAGFVYVGPVGDAGWTFQHDQGRKALAALPFVKSTSFIESVPEDPKLAAAAIDKLIAEGANLIFTTSFGYMDPTLEAAARHPEVVFMHCSGFRTAPNVGTYFGREYEGRYLAGMLAGGMTESGIIGYVAAFPLPEVVRGINAFTLGALSVNADVTVQVVWSNTWYGPGIEREEAQRLIDFGADVLTMHQDSPAVLQAAEQQGKRALGYHSDMSLFAPRATLTSVMWDWTPLYRKIAEDLHAGRWQPEQLWWGLDRGVVKLAPLNPDLPDSLRERVLAAEKAIAGGTLRPFEGTIRDNRGEVRVPARRTLSDAELLSMDYFVLGVKGSLPEPKPAAGPPG